MKLETKRQVAKALLAVATLIESRKVQLERMLGDGEEFAVLSAYMDAPTSENKERHGRLLADLQRKGLKWKDVTGKWGLKKEKSILIPNISFDDAMALGNEYQQDAVIFKSADGVVGMYYLKGTPKVDLGWQADTKVSDGKDLYSKTRNWSFEYGFPIQNAPWSGSGPVTAEEYWEISDNQGVAQNQAAE